MEIRLVKQEDAERLSSYFCDNEHHFRVWEPIREPGYYSEVSLTERLTEYEELHRKGAAAHFIGVINTDVVAHCSLTNVVYGPLRACFMGYGVAKSHEGTGAMTKVCTAAINYAFTELALNRIMANYMPCNRRSANLLNKLGFSKEGLAKRYLKINGKWEDHVLTSLLNPENS